MGVKGRGGASELGWEARRSPSEIDSNEISRKTPNIWKLNIFLNLSQRGNYKGNLKTF